MIDTPDERNSKCGTCGSWEECKCPSPYDDEEWLAQQRADAMMEEDMIDTDKYERLHNLAHCKVLTQLYADDILDLLAEVKQLRKADWEYECLWTWLDENTNLLNTIEPLMEEWKEMMKNE